MKLNEFSPAADLLECLLESHRVNFPEDNLIYDDDNDRYVSVGSVREVIEQLRDAEV